MFARDLLDEAERLLAELRRRHLRLATAESCTGGLVAALLTEIPGASDVFDRGFVTYTIDAKRRMLGVPQALVDLHGVVSPECARAMALGALANSAADMAVAVTGLAGPGGGTPAKPVGLVHLAVAARSSRVLQRELRLPDQGRTAIRLASVAAALALIHELLLLAT
jgi:nicotinamide-nucleotide amidase